MIVKVHVPASIGNIGVGFDTLGIAITPIDDSLLEDCVSIEDADSFTITNTGLFHDQLPIKLEENVVFQCCKRFSKIFNKPVLPVCIKLEKNIPVSSGLGSSASSIVATLTALNYYYNNFLNKTQLLKLMGELEGKISGSIHFDNIAPCFLGGMQIILPEYSEIGQMIPIFEHWKWIVAYPGIKISTIQSRSVLPKQYSYMDCITHSQYLSGFIHACHTKQELLAIKYIQHDVIAEPYRFKLLPVDLSYIKRVLIEKGASACGISGSGPTIFALCNTQDIISDVVEWLSCYYLQNSSGFVKVCSLNTLGAHVVAE